MEAVKAIDSIRPHDDLTAGGSGTSVVIGERTADMIRTEHAR